MKTFAYDTLKRVLDALTKNGYGIKDIVAARFEGWNHQGHEVHVISFLNDGRPDSGNVYIDKEGKGEF